MTSAPRRTLQNRFGRKQGLGLHENARAISRARALATRLRETMPKEEFQSLCCYNAESHAILQALEANGNQLDFSTMKMYPCVVPDKGVSDKTMDAALAKLNELVEQSRSAKKKPWWKFW